MRQEKPNDPSVFNYDTPAFFTAVWFRRVVEERCDADGVVFDLCFKAFKGALR